MNQSTVRARVARLVEQSHQLVTLIGQEATVDHTPRLLALLISAAAKAAERGDYGIGAVAVAPHGHAEITVAAGNTILSEQNPVGHAEANALLTLFRVRSYLASDGNKTQNPVPASVCGGHTVQINGRRRVEDLTVYTSQEPCPLCTVCILNAGTRRVIVASKDVKAGALLEGRLERLGPLWREVALGRGLIAEELPSNPYRDRVEAVLESLALETGRLLDPSIQLGLFKTTSKHPLGNLGSQKP